MLEIAIGAGLVIAGAAIARALWRKRIDRSSTPPATNGTPGRALSDAPRGLCVGDVILYGDSELWLAGALDLDEEGFVLRVFRTPGSPRAEWVAQLDASARDLALLRVTDEVPGGVVPEQLRVAGVRVMLERRGQASVRRQGEQLPTYSGDRTRYAVLAGPGGRIVIVLDAASGDRLALHGERVGREMLDVLPGGDVAAD